MELENTHIQNMSLYKNMTYRGEWKRGQLTDSILRSLAGPYAMGQYSPEVFRNVTAVCYLTVYNGNALCCNYG